MIFIFEDLCMLAVHMIIYIILQNSSGPSPILVPNPFDGAQTAEQSSDVDISVD